MQNRVFGPYLTTNNRILISVMFRELWKHKDMHKDSQEWRHLKSSHECSKVRFACSSLSRYPNRYWSLQPRRAAQVDGTRCLPRPARTNVTENAVLMRTRYRVRYNIDDKIVNTLAAESQFEKQRLRSSWWRAKGSSGVKTCLEIARQTWHSKHRTRAPNEEVVYNSHTRTSNLSLLKNNTQQVEVPLAAPRHQSPKAHPKGNSRPKLLVPPRLPRVQHLSKSIFARNTCFSAFQLVKDRPPGLNPAVLNGRERQV
jgi:hypothetical protein